MNLARQLTGIDEGVIRSPWSDHETVRGFAVMRLPIASGHVLASRFIPQSDFGPYATLWLRRPDGRWSLHVDGPRLDGADLGAPVRLEEPPRFGDFRLPSCPLFAVGEAHQRVPDREEYERLREAVGAGVG